ncbi:hypothetical protein M3Y97_00330400 [Aphelenchoides bicaudatus]|nr:hypothetical protein M3Y97_00330400 [Aphelenchoides bicaudatus]
MDIFGLLFLFLANSGVESHAIYAINWVEESHEVTTPETSIQDRFFRFPTNTITFEDKTIVKVLKTEDAVQTTETIALDQTSATTASTQQIEKLENPLALNVENSTIALALTAEPIPPVMVVGQISKRDVSIQQKQLKLSPFERFVRRFKRDEWAASGTDDYPFEYVLT